MPNSLADGRYQLGQSIGHGGMAEVRVALDTRLGRTVAIKIMRSDLANDQIFLTRFRREAHAVAQMNNPNIVNIYDSGEETVTNDDGTTERLPYLVMEYVKGQTLRDIIKANGALSQRDAEQVMLGVLSALEYSHRMGIIHRDIKPGNIMISEQGVVKVMDFGIARALDDSAATMTQSQGVVGTAQYLSPEQARGETVDMRSDLYSAGCVLYEMLTGRAPFVGDSAVAIAYQHVSEVATPPSAIVPGLPKMWDSICAKAMAKDRQNRYATAAEFRNDILTFMNGGMPVAAAFNPLTDLANMKARREAEQQQERQNPTATMTMGQTVPMGAGVPGPGAVSGSGVGETTATQAFNPITGQFEVVPSMRPAGGAGGTGVRSRAEQRAAAAKAKRKKIILGSVLGGIVVIALIVAAFFMLNNANVTANEETVPDFTSMSNITEAKVKAQLEDLGLTLDPQEDNDSSEPKGTVTKQTPKGGTKVAKGSAVKVWFSTGPQSINVPDVSEETQEAARASLEQAGFKVASTVKSVQSATVAQDLVVKTDPAAGTSQPKGTEITLYVSTGSSSMPDVTGQPKDAALTTLRSYGLLPTVYTEASDTVPKDSVIRTDPAAGQQIDQNQQITVYVSSGPEQVAVPDACAPGQSYADCAAALTAAGLNPTAGGAGENGVVESTNPAVGTQVDKGSSVTVTTKKSESSGSGNENGTDNNGSNSGSDNNGTDNGSTDNSGSDNNGSGSGTTNNGGSGSGTETGGTTNNGGSGSNSGTSGN
ncbi:Stk1 family PASTA domain-containing Ser/Thr kinase [Bifidobacterium sp. 82T10]|uniref:non-specific serine/threonine protein kinase n=2 Tax=Bifidobacterium miconis TaxID=2834435 RepID=A0ABS6WIR0_9BIFI|nr:Stk1 family PASTA domain-containing Ser/Thr kinase [Bifidobacterium miconis]MBW3093655.1 Stk1 family PASTA domain-containing Ser/Thr kinase [Bifidobacterium miconis]